jgi:putative ABC transport system permease protein
VLAAIGGLGARLPLSGRLAVRDAVRHRRRTSVAVVAVALTVGAVVVTAFVLAGRPPAQRVMPEHTMLARLDPVSTYRVGSGQEQLTKAMADMAAAVPGTVAREIRVATAHQEGAASAAVLADAHGSATAPGCWSARTGIGTDLVDLYVGRAPDAEVRAAMAAGEVVVFDDCLISPAGTVTFTANLPAPVELPAHLANRALMHHDYYGEVPAAFVSEETAARLGWQTYSTAGVVNYPASATEDDIAALQAAAEDAGVDTAVEDTADEAANLPFVLAVVAGLIALLGSGMVVALSAADGRNDLAILAALGAQPWRRRTVVGAQALVVSGLGAVAGVVLGGGVGFAAVPVSGGAGFAVPWAQALLTALAVPLVAVVVAMAVTPGRLPMVQGRQS